VLEALSAQERADLRATALRALGPGDESRDVAWDVVADLGWSAIGVPEDLGGAGYGHRERVVLAEAAGETLHGEALFPTLGLALPLATAAGAAGLTKEMVAGARAAVGWERPGVGSFSRGPVAPALSFDGSRASGTLSAVGGARDADLLLAPAAAVDGGVVLIAVRGGAFHCRDPRPGYLDADQRALAVEVDGTAEVVAEGSTARRAWVRTRDAGQLWLAAESLGIATHLLALGVIHAQERRQFDRAIGSYQAVAHQLADLYADVELARSAVAWAAEAVDGDQADAEQAVLVASLMADAAAVSAGEKAIQVLGGLGMTWESVVHRYFKRALLNELFDGSPRQRRRRLADLVLPAERRADS